MKRTKTKLKDNDRKRFWMLSQAKCFRFIKVDEKKKIQVNF